MTQTDKMLSRKEGGIGYLIFNNPDRLNAVSLDMWAATHRILEDFRNDNDVRVVVVTGAGGKAFVSGRRYFRVREAALQSGAGRRNTTRPATRRSPASTSFPSRRSR